jgi:hypothetical protein
MWSPPHLWGRGKTLNGGRSRWSTPAERAILSRKEVITMEVYETYTSVLVVLSIALLLVAAGVGKRKLEWKPLRVTVRSRRPRGRRITRD